MNDFYGEGSENEEWGSGGVEGGGGGQVQGSMVSFGTRDIFSSYEVKHPASLSLKVKCTQSVKMNNNYISGNTYIG